ncbi:energy transducer TonB [Flavobacterium antarcticum]|uniref:energy transducer TonB n=1 Tax=Flavobacterium antarcticum TaxID=271155 RepID=UPI0003B3303F|nr:energy transducer TonB [Flavobacterium antarcticum]
MANQSIYSEEWIDVVFENRNKEYGAYQLRHENPKTTLKALGIGVLLLTFLVSIPMMMNLFGTKPTATASIPELVTPLVISPVIYPPKKTDTKDLFPPLTQKENKKPKTDIKKENLIDPKVTEAENAVTEIAPNDDPQENDVEPIDGAILGTENSGVKGGTATPSGTTESGTSGADNGSHVAAVLDKQPTFPGGMTKFYNYVAQNFKTPETELANSIKVYVSFVIEKDGTMTDIQVLRNPGFGLDKEAIRVLKSLKTKWTPGILNGKPVRTAYNLPILIKQN